MRSGDVDPLWEHFSPLWQALNAVAPDLLLAGGYGLFLKQKRMLETPTERIVVPYEQWLDGVPRATKDLDLVVGIKIIASRQIQGKLVAALNQCGFVVSERNPRWQFEKHLSEMRTIRVDLHSPLPSENLHSLQADRIRVKHKPSLGDDGIHGRTNPEAVGCELQPFILEVGGLVIQMPNPVTWSVMKLVAMKDHWISSENIDQSEEKREFSRFQAIKHAQDVFRVVAMATRDESDVTVTVVNAIRNAPAFANATKIFKQSFIDHDGWGSRSVAHVWRPEHFQLIRNTLAGWLR